MIYGGENGQSYGHVLFRFSNCLRSCEVRDVGALQQVLNFQVLEAHLLIYLSSFLFIYCLQWLADRPSHHFPLQWQVFGTKLQQ